MGHLTEQMRATSSPAGCWTAIRQRSCQIVIEQREIAPISHDAQHLVFEAPFERRAAGPVESALQELGQLPVSCSIGLRSWAIRWPLF